MRHCFRCLTEHTRTSTNDALIAIWSVVDRQERTRLNEKAHAPRVKGLWPENGPKHFASPRWPVVVGCCLCVTEWLLVIDCIQFRDNELHSSDYHFQAGKQSKTKKPNVLASCKTLYRHLLPSSLETCKNSDKVMQLIWLNWILYFCRF